MSLVFHSYISSNDVTLSQPLDFFSTINHSMAPSLQIMKWLTIKIRYIRSSILVAMVYMCVHLYNKVWIMDPINWVPLKFLQGTLYRSSSHSAFASYGLQTLGPTQSYIIWPKKKTQSYIEWGLLRPTTLISVALFWSSCRKHIGALHGKCSCFYTWKCMAVFYNNFPFPTPLDLWDIPTWNPSPCLSSSTSFTTFIFLHKLISQIFYSPLSLAQTYSPQTITIRSIFSKNTTDQTLISLCLFIFPFLSIPLFHKNTQREHNGVGE